MGILNNLKFANDIRTEGIDSDVSLEYKKNIVDILYTEGTESYPSEFYYFTLYQPIEIVESVKNKYNTNKSFKNHIDNYEFEDDTVLNSDKELDMYVYMIENEIPCSHDVFLNYVSQGGDIDVAKKIVKAISLEDVNIWDDEVEELISSPVISKLSSNEIYTLIKVCESNFETQYKDIKEEDLWTLNEPLIVYCRDINSEQLKLIKRLNEYVSEDCLAMTKSSNLLMDNVTVACSIIDEMVKANYNNLQIEKVMISIQEAIKQNIILDTNDLNLIKNKIANGSIFEDVITIAKTISNCNMDFNIGTYSRIVKFKKIVNKNVYKKFMKSEALTKAIGVCNRVYGHINRLSNIIEFGQLKDDEVLYICRYCATNNIRSEDLIIKLENLKYKLSYEEFSTIMHKDDFVTSEILNSFYGLKSSERLLKIKEAINIGLVVTNSKIATSYDEVVSATEGVLVTRLMERNNPLNLKSFSDYVEYIVISKKFEIKNYREFNLIKYAYRENITDLSMEDLEKSIMELDRTKEILNYLKLSNEFFEKYKDNLLDFLVSDKSSLLRSYINNYYVRDLQKNNIVLIAKSIIAGEYENLKFVKEDIFNEIMVTMDDEEFEAWKRTDVISEGDIRVEDASDFETIMTIGAQPVKSCMNYQSGSYSYCLLSNFDTSKKILKIYKRDKYIGRAILRLTKMSESGKIPNGDTSLKFIDFDATNESQSVESNNEDTILFLERLYSSAKDEFADIFPIVKKHLLAKANSVGAKLVVSGDYSDYELDDEQSVVSRYVFITGSKNGEQYLDSFGGGTSKEHCYKQGSVIVYN